MSSTPVSERDSSLVNVVPPSPPFRHWQTYRPRYHAFLGFLLTDEVAQYYCSRQCPPLDEDEMRSHTGHISYLQTDGIQAELGDKYSLWNFLSVLVYKDRKHTAMDFVLVLADNQGPDDDQRVPPSPEVVALIADELGLEGAEREPRWYKPAWWYVVFDFPATASAHILVDLEILKILGCNFPQSSHSMTYSRRAAPTLRAPITSGSFPFTSTTQKHAPQSLCDVRDNT